MSTERKIEEIIAEVDGLLEAGEDAKAEEGLLEAIAQYTAAQPGNVVGQSVLLNELGSFYRSRGSFVKGERAFLRAKALLEEIREHVCLVDGPDPAAGCCTCGPETCGSPFGGGEGERHAEIIYANERMTANYATTLNNLAGLYRMTGQLEKALETFDAAIEVYENCPGKVAPDYLASGYNNKGLVYLDMRDAGRARAMFLRAKETLERGGDYKFAMGTTLSNLGFACVMEQKRPEAIAHFSQAKNLFEGAGNGEMARSCQELLSRLGAGQ